MLDPTCRLLDEWPFHAAPESATALATQVTDSTNVEWMQERNTKALRGHLTSRFI